MLSMGDVPGVFLQLNEESDMEKAKVMVVENETVVALDILSNLEGWGYTITELVATGEDAVASATKNPPDFILMDMDLNGTLNSRETAKQIETAMDVPIIFLTSKMEYGGGEGISPSEPYKYIAKPFKDRDLQLAIEMALYYHHLKKELREGEEKYRLLAESLSQAFFELDELGVITFANDSFCRLLDYSHQLVQGLSAVEITDKSGARLLTKLVMGNVKATQNQLLINLYGKDGRKIKAGITARRIERRQDGTSANALLALLHPDGNPDAPQMMAQSEPREMTEEEQVDRMKLKEMVKSLRSILEKRKQETKMIQNQVTTNVRELVLPYIRNIRKTELDLRQKAYVDILESNLEEIISPFAKVLSTREFNLTPSEMQIANLVKQGKSTKYIAKLLNLSRRTVESHRRNIRIKLGLKNKKANMRSFLASID